MTESPQLELPPRNLLVPASLICLGTVGAAYGLWTVPDRAWPNLLLGVFYITSLSLSALFFLATQRLTGARWSANLRRIPEAFAVAMPVLAVLMLLVLFFGRHTLFPWTHAGAFDRVPTWAGKIRYLRTSWVFARAAVVLPCWAFFALLLRRASLEQDRRPEMSLIQHARMTSYAVFFVLAFALTFTLCTYDWLLSLDPQWVSTMFAIYVFAGTFVQGIAAVTLAAILLKERGPLSGLVSEHQFHDLGKMIFAFSTFWAYIWTCQYLLIWYGNIPEEVTHYVKRTSGPWLIWFAINFIINWVIPFTVLLSVRAKRSVNVLSGVCVLVLVGHWLDLYLIVMPASWNAPKLGWLEILTAAGCASLLYCLVVRALQQAPLVPLHDPVLAYEQLHNPAQTACHSALMRVKQ